MKDLIPNLIEGIALIFIGILAVLLFTHLLNGTLGSWIDAKFHAAGISDIANAASNLSSTTPKTTADTGTPAKNLTGASSAEGGG